MPLSLVSNVASIKAQGQLNRTTQALGKTFERLSSGLRINSASDDPAGLMMADSLRADAKLASVAVRNANDGISMAAIADAALQNIGEILQRMSELATQSSNGTFTNVQRSALSSEFIALGSEIDRIAKTTTFNNINLLSTSSNVAIQVGLRGSANDLITIGSVVGTLQALGIGNASGALTFSISDSTANLAAAAAASASSMLTNAINTVGSLRGTLGAAESRLSTAVNYLTVARENFVAAESRIRDVDVAQEVAQMVRLQILQQSGAAIVAQANQQPSVVLSLLK
ncbi:MAG: flagellin FliC [Deltaproteobacteria bacterium]|nr:flagellin FliC [Deltaproteobacteria bacterium]